MTIKDLIAFFKEKLEKVIDIISLHCPECGGQLDMIYWGGTMELNIYECRECKKQFI